MANPGTPERVASLATAKEAVDMSNTLVLGVFGPDTDLRALVRLPSGRVREVTRGARLNTWTIAGIDEEGLVLQRRDKTTRMAIAR
jgi:hypothetical protein